MLRSIRSRGAKLIASIAFVCAVFTVVMPIPSAFAQNAKEATARALILEAWTTSRASDLVADARRYLHSTAAPIMRDYVSGKLKMPLAQEPQFRDIFNEAINFVLILEKASSEFEVVIEKDRDELIDDMARILAKHLSDVEMQAAREILQLSAARKGFDAVYKFYHIAFSFTYDEELANQRFNIWTQELFLQYVRRGWQLDRTPATPERIAKATSIVNELMAALHLDAVIADGLRFAREIVMPLAPSDAERAELRAKLDEFETQYHTWKPVGWVAAYTGLAMALNEEQLTILQAHMRGPGVTKMFRLLHEAEQAFTAFTLADFETAKTFFEAQQAKGVFPDRSAEAKAAINADIKALGDKWGPRLAASISPETRDALIVSALKLWGVAEIEFLRQQGQKL
jgi:hypothetical protein